jgi:hypothetical protein
LLPFLAEQSQTRTLYIIATILTSCGPLFAWTTLRSTNGALAIRADKLAGVAPPTIALTYSRREHWSKALEERCGTAELMRRWQRLNSWRSILLVLGTVVGAVGIAVGDL